jgi:hypothetical protein
VAIELDFHVGISGLEVFMMLTKNGFLTATFLYFIEVRLRVYAASVMSSCPDSFGIGTNISLNFRGELQFNSRVVKKYHLSGEDLNGKYI